MKGIVFLFYVINSPRWHDYALGAVITLIRNGHVNPDQVVVRCSLWHMHRTVHGREIVARYRELGVQLTDCGLLEHEGWGPAKHLAIDATLAAGHEAVVMVDADTLFLADIDLNAWTASIHGSGMAFANFENPADAVFEYWRRVSQGPGMPGISSSSAGVESLRRDMLYRRFFGFAESEFVEWLKGRNWVYGGVWYARANIRDNTVWRSCCDYAWFNCSDEIASQLMRWRSGLPCGWLDGRGVAHRVVEGEIDFSVEVPGWIHYAGPGRDINLDKITNYISGLWTPTSS